MDTRNLIATAALLAAGVAPGCACAQGVATDNLIDAITVTGARQRISVEVPSTTASKTAEELRTQNLFNPEDALKYVPNLTIRKRYIGDRNALIGGRSFSTLQAPRGLVFMDGYLLSNFLGRFDAPRWNMIAPEEIERRFPDAFSFERAMAIGNVHQLKFVQYSSILPVKAIGVRMPGVGIDELGFVDIMADGLNGHSPVRLTLPQGTEQIVIVIFAEQLHYNAKKCKRKIKNTMLNKYTLKLL